jgi:hypothetical protein
LDAIGALASYALLGELDSSAVLAGIVLLAERASAHLEVAA